MKPQFLIYTLILTACISGRVYSKNGDSLKVKRLVITTSILEYIPAYREFFPRLNLNAGNLNLGAEIHLKERKSLYVNLGVVKSYAPPVGWFGIVSLNTQGIKVQAEGRHYLNRHKIFEPAILLFWPHIFQYKSQVFGNTGYYVAIHSSGEWTSTQRPEDYQSENTYTVNRSITTLNIKFGYQCIRKYGLTVDYSVGLGGQYVSSRSKNRRVSDTGWPGQQQDFPGKLFDHGRGFYPNVVYHVRLGWVL